MKIMEKIRIRVVVLLTLAILGVINYQIFKKERTIAEGRIVLLKLVPVDPRSLMQGDYMRLRYQIADRIKMKPFHYKELVVVRLDKHDVASFRKFYNGGLLLPNEQLIVCRNKRTPQIGADSFMFQEGHGNIYSNAEYGELKVDKEGNSVLVGLRDKNFKRLGPKMK